MIIRGDVVPELCRFYGLRISMNFDDHNPPHFHVEYGEDEASFAISDGGVTAGELPARAVKMVKEWWGLHAEELAANWLLAKNSEPIFKIEPLR